MRVPVVQHHRDPFRLSLVPLGQLAHGQGPSRAAAPLRHLHLAPTGERLGKQKQMGHALSLLLVVLASWLARSRRQSQARFADQLLAGLLPTDHGMGRVQRTLLDRQHVFQGGHQLGIVRRRNRPVLFPVRRPFVFFRVRRTVSYETAGTGGNSTKRSARRRHVHGAWPAGAGPPAQAIRWASAVPSRLRSYRRVVGWGRKAASRLSSTKRWRTRATVVAGTASASRMASSLPAGAAGLSSAFHKIGRAVRHGPTLSRCEPLARAGPVPQELSGQCTFSR
jgi:hypothetical protein